MELNFRKKYDYLDTCIILRIILGDIPEQKKRAIELLLSGKTFYVDGVAIMEAAHVMARDHYSRTDIVENLKEFLSNTMIEYDKTLFDKALEDYKNHPSLSLDDCVLAARASGQDGSTVWTFDKKFANQSEVATLVK